MATKDPERDTAVGVFTDFTHAEQAIDALRGSGFASDKIGFLADDPERMLPPPEQSGTEAGAGMAIGAIVGGVLGTALGVAVVVLPVVGPVIAGGLLAGALGGAVTGAASGGVLGALIGMNVPEEEARHCEQQFHSGRSLVTVHAGERYEEAVAIMRRVKEQSEDHHAPRRPPGSSSDMGPGGGGSAVVPRM